MNYGDLSLEDIARQYGTPLYVYDAASMRAQLQALSAALPSRIELFYSVKSNPNPEVVRVFVQSGTGCEIASAAEYRRALAAGCAPEKILFAGPGKAEEELVEVVRRGVGEIHVESQEEIALLGAIARRLERRVGVSIRVNPARSAAGGAMQMGGQPSWFGIDEERLEEAVGWVRAEPALQLRGLHQFAGTQILDANVLVGQWRHALSLGEKFAALTGHPPQTLDLGGGLGIPYFAGDQPLDLEELKARAAELFGRLPALFAGTRFIVEPGRFLVGPSGLYLTRVRSVKVSRGSTFVVLDGGMHHHLAASGNLGQVIKRDYPVISVSHSGSPATLTATLVGPLCTPLDTLARKAQIAPVARGDLLAILQSGAYGLTASPVGFLSHPMPAEVLVDAGVAHCIRARGTFDAPLVQLPI
jgi:diaminopimelate decarboxylase